jgi:hypothetical protein
MMVTVMLELLLVIVLAVLIAVMVGAVAIGSWSRHWVASGRDTAGRRYPGGPIHRS